MRILFVGDIMGRAGREALEKYLPGLKRDLRADAVIVNGENAAHGRGITAKFCKDFFALGVDCITTGNHVWDQREVLAYIHREPRLLRPANFPEHTPGQGLYVHQLQDGRKIAVINVMARLFMDALDCPFKVTESLLKDHRLEIDCDAIFVDLHGEATSEKMAFAHHFDGKVTAVIGTHTHIPTADAHIMAGGTAYMSDAGMTGDYDSVIGIQKAQSIERFVKKLPGAHFIPAGENKTLCGALVVANNNTGGATAIEPVRIGDTLSNTIPDI